MKALTYTVENQEVELKMQQEKIDRLEEAVEFLRRAQNNSSNSTATIVDPFVKKNLSSLQEGLLKMVVDIKTLKNQGNQSADFLSSADSKIALLEKRLETQGEALTSLCQALDINVNFSAQKSVVVQAGDSLERIARRHDTTINTLKKLNNKNNDLIYVGETLHIP